jgi:hypothetical protein
MSHSLASKPKRRITIRVCVGILVLLAGLIWVLDGYLLARIIIIASDSTFDGNLGHGQLVIDGSDQLKNYPPGRLLNFLRLPSPEIRAAVCLSLAEREDKDRNPVEWAGVLPKMLDLAVKDGSIVVRNAARDVIYSLSSISPSEQEIAWEFVKRPTPNSDGCRDVRIRLIGKLHRMNLDSLPTILAIYHSWVDSFDDRRAALRELLTLSPDDSETYAKFRWFIDNGEANPEGGIETMMRRHPELIDEFLRGNERQRKLLFDVAVREVKHGAKSDLLTEAHFQRIETVLVDLVKQEDSSTLILAGDFLVRRPNGGDLIIADARRKSGGSRAYLVRVLRSWALMHPEKAANYVDELLQWLREDETRVQDAVLHYMVGDLRRFDIDERWLKSQRSGPDSPIVDACRRFVDEFPGRAEYHSFAILISAATPDRPDDVDRLATFADRELDRFEKNVNYINPFKPQNGRAQQDQTADHFCKWLNRYPDLKRRPAVKRYLDHRAALEAKKILLPLGAPNK